MANMTELKPGYEPHTEDFFAKGAPTLELMKRDGQTPEQVKALMDRIARERSAQMVSR